MSSLLGGNWPGAALIARHGPGTWTWDLGRGARGMGWGPVGWGPVGWGPVGWGPVGWGPVGWGHRSGAGGPSLGLGSGGLGGWGLTACDPKGAGGRLRAGIAVCSPGVGA